VYANAASNQTSKKKSDMDKDPVLIPLAGANYLLIDSKGFLRQGTTGIRLWSNKEACPVGPCGESFSESDPHVFVHFEEFSHPVVFPNFPSTDLSEDELERIVSAAKIAAQPSLSTISTLISNDSLSSLDENSRNLIWNHRNYLLCFPESLPKLLLSLKWDSFEEVAEMHR
jgi:phosphatidylinositol-4,5-bisphosphate 3-kinase